VILALLFPKVQTFLDSGIAFAYASYLLAGKKLFHP